MTWPWILHLRDAASDPGDPYLISWILWWDYHQTFNDPLNLFHANIFYPYKYTLAFSEHHYGIALFFFPLFALGLQPLTVHGIASLIGFAFCGYGAFRLARTLTGSSTAAWVSGIAFAFVPYRFGQLPHLVYLFSGWIPIVLEALVLFVRKPSWKRAIWLGAAFFFNGLSAIHWFVLTLLPLALSAFVLLTRWSAWRKRELWIRGVTAVGFASLALLPFFIPYLQAARLYGFVRNPEEAAFYSARLIDWLVPDLRNKYWRGLNATLRFGERQLFPGFIPLLLATAAILVVDPGKAAEKRSRAKKTLLLLLDVILIISPVLMVTISGYGFFKMRVFGYYLFEIRSAGPVLAVFLLALAVRLSVAYPYAFIRQREGSFLSSLRTNLRTDAFYIGIIWTVIGFMGSLGMNFVFHGTLFKFVPLFWSIRAPARWAMICYLGLALLAGLGAMQLADLVRRHWPRFHPVPLVLILAIGLLVEQRAAPLDLIGGQVDPDELALRLKQTKMAGGIVELPFDGASQSPIYHYVLRSADHGKPLVTAVSGFIPPIQGQIHVMTSTDPVPDAFFDLLESIPASYLVLHNEFLYADAPRLKEMLRRGTETGRLRYVNRFDGRSDLYAVVKTEPQVATEGKLPSYLINGVEGGEPTSLDDTQSFVRNQYQQVLGREADPGGLQFWSEQIRRCGNSTSCSQETRINVSAALFFGEEFQQTALFINNLYQHSLGRQPSYGEFAKDRAALKAGPQLELTKRAFVDRWLKREELAKRYPANSTNESFVDELLKVWQPEATKEGAVDRARLLGELNNGVSRADLLRRIAEQQSPSSIEHNRVVVRLAYFVYLKREPSPDEVAQWLQKLQGPGGQREMIESFLTLSNYQ